MNTNNKMKKSIYNHLSFIDGTWVLYNAYSDEVGILADEVKKMYEDKTLDEIKTAHPEFYKFLQEKGFSVPSLEVESEKCIKKWEKEDEDPSSFSLTINPTLDCNMRCWYCYENHQKKRTMSTEISERIFKFISKKMAETNLKEFDLSFFGGEPLIRYRSIVQPLTEHACKLAELHQKKMSIGFTTNGYLLTSTVADYLSSLNVPLHFQITLDGNEKSHDKIRHTINGSGSYAQILDNCKQVLLNPLASITLRCNYTAENAVTFMDLVSDLEERGITPSSSLHIDFQRVWQDKGNNDEIERQIESVQQVLRKKGFSTSDIQAQEKYRCYAERSNHIVVNYDGGLFHCTARDFTPENSEGTICDDGTLLLNEKSAVRKKVKWGNTTCMECRIYPLCNGLCSQQKVEHIGASGCIAGYTEEDKKLIFEKRIRYIIEMGKTLPIN